MIRFLLLISLLVLGHAHAFEDSSYLKGGISYAKENINALVGTEDDVKALGINSSFGYKWVNAEFYVTSNIYFGKVDDLSFKAGGESYTGSGNFRSVTIGPSLKYVLPLHLNKVWHFYLTAGPHWSIQTIEFKNYTTTNSHLNHKFKLTYESFGPSIGIGIEEQIPHAELHPVFFEIIYIRRSSYKVSVVDTSNTAEINIVTTNEAKQDITENIILVNLGVTIF